MVNTVSCWVLFLFLISILLVTIPRCLTLVLWFSIVVHRGTFAISRSLLSRWPVNTLFSLRCFLLLFFSWSSLLFSLLVLLFLFSSRSHLFLLLLGVCHFYDF